MKIPVLLLSLLIFVMLTVSVSAQSSLQVAFDQTQICLVALNGVTINSFRWELLQQQPLVVNIYFVSGVNTVGTIIALQGVRYNDTTLQYSILIQTVSLDGKGVFTVQSLNPNYLVTTSVSQYQNTNINYGTPPQKYSLDAAFLLNAKYMVQVAGQDVCAVQWSQVPLVNGTSLQLWSYDLSGTISGTETVTGLGTTVLTCGGYSGAGFIYKGPVQGTQYTVWTVYAGSELTVRPISSFQGKSLVLTANKDKYSAGDLVVLSFTLPTANPTNVTVRINEVGLQLPRYTDYHSGYDPATLLGFVEFTPLDSGRIYQVLVAVVTPEGNYAGNVAITPAAPVYTSIYLILAVLIIVVLVVFVVVLWKFVLHPKVKESIDSMIDQGFKRSS